MLYRFSDDFRGNRSWLFAQIRLILEVWSLTTNHKWYNAEYSASSDSLLMEHFLTISILTKRKNSMELMKSSSEYAITIPCFASSNYCTINCRNRNRKRMMSDYIFVFIKFWLWRKLWRKRWWTHKLISIVISKRDQSWNLSKKWTNIINKKATQKN